MSVFISDKERDKSINFFLDFRRIGLENNLHYEAKIAWEKAIFKYVQFVKLAQCVTFLTLRSYS